jgi:hypothetical protein
MGDDRDIEAGLARLRELRSRALTLHDRMQEQNQQMV